MAEEIGNVEETERGEPAVVIERSRSNLPFILTLAALLIYFGFQTLQLLTERGNLGMVKNSQEAAIQEAQKLQSQFKALVGKVGELADQGHAGAKMVMDELFNRGTGSPPQSSAPSRTESRP